MTVFFWETTSFQFVIQGVFFFLLTHFDPEYCFYYLKYQILVFCIVLCDSCGFSTYQIHTSTVSDHFAKVEKQKVSILDKVINLRKFS